MKKKHLNAVVWFNMADLSESRVESHIFIDFSRLCTIVYANFHQRFLKDKILIILCPKLGHRSVCR